jgi:phage shock protein PspC (stress-responsive transcriptional regulator)
MYRSFTDRVLGGVCGGLGGLLRINSWWFRGAFVALSIVTLGAFALLYLALWLAIPQESLTSRQRGGSTFLLLTIILTAATLIAWISSISGGLRGASGENLLWPGMLLGVSVIFFMRQVRG